MSKTSYQVIRVSSNYQVLVLEDLDDAQRGRADRFLVFDRDRLLHDRRHRIERADMGNDVSVFERADQEGIDPYIDGNLSHLGFGELPRDGFSTVAAAWRWLRLKQAECADDDIEYYEERLQGDSGNKFFKSMLSERRAFVDYIRRKFI